MCECVCVCVCRDQKPQIRVEGTPKPTLPKACAWKPFPQAHGALASSLHKNIACTVAFNPRGCRDRRREPQLFEPGFSRGASFWADAKKKKEARWRAFVLQASSVGRFNSPGGGSPHGGRREERACEEEEEAAAALRCSLALLHATKRRASERAEAEGCLWGFAFRVPLPGAQLETKARAATLRPSGPAGVPLQLGEQEPRGRCRVSPALPGTLPGRRGPALGPTAGRGEARRARDERARPFLSPRGTRTARSPAEARPGPGGKTFSSASASVSRARGRAREGGRGGGGSDPPSAAPPRRAADLVRLRFIVVVLGAHGHGHGSWWASARAR